MDPAALPTPCAVVDLDTVERNTRRMAERMARLGVRLRPHVKTHKCVEAARLQTRGHFGGITVSTLAEARHFASAGFRDITWAFPLPLPRIREAAELALSIDRLNLTIDNSAALHALETFPAASAFRFSVFLEVDCGDHRSGVDPGDPEAIALARRMAASEAIDFRGILTHAGHSYAARGVEEIREVAREERDAAAAFASRLRAAGVNVHDVSVGSTPTMSLAENLDGVTEARPGNYVFYDAFQASIGSCSLDDAAFSVLTTVVGHYPSRNRMIVDAGALALSKDAGPRHVAEGCGFGEFFDLAGRRLPELRLVKLSQEHGQIEGGEPLRYERYPLGSRLRIVPNHSCLAAALYDRYHVVQEGRVAAEWRPVRGWNS
jgi:D-serine deaminase-like pyridoxal phosphate-dependent protein